MTVDAPYEKRGNSTWAQCPDCDHWFHVSPALLEMRDVDLICPGCALSFSSDTAKNLLEN